MEKAFHPEVLKRYMENKETEELLECLETYEPDSVSIGEGKNAEVFSVDDGKFVNVCMKKIKKTPMLKCNDLDTEVDFQNRVRELGIKTPLTFAHIRNVEDKDKSEMILMERIHGVTIKDIVYGNEPVPEQYNHKRFFEKLKENVKKMHEHNIHHRDLHEDNIMIDSEGDPVIIDFGTACTAFSGDEHPYSEQVLMYDPQSERYKLAAGYFKADDLMVYQLQQVMRPYAENKGVLT